MAQSLKDKNRLPLAGVLLVNLIIIVFLLGISDAILSGFIGIAANAAFAAFGLAVAGIINNQLSPVTKARIAFLRWRDPLPGCRAFTKYIFEDDRIDSARLLALHGPFPVEPREQNSLWYRWYKEVGDESSVNDAHRAYLFSRDYSSLAVLLLIFIWPLLWLISHGAVVVFLYLAFLLIQFSVASQSARNAGSRFVTTVLAIKGAKT